MHLKIIIAEVDDGYLRNSLLERSIKQRREFVYLETRKIEQGEAFNLCFIHNRFELVDENLAPVLIRYDENHANLRGRMNTACNALSSCR